jgi:threonine dehydratase
VCNVIAREGGNVITVSHERINSSTEINGCTIRIELETRDNEHIDLLRNALQKEGYNVLN